MDDNLSSEAGLRDIIGSDLEDEYSSAPETNVDPFADEFKEFINSKTQSIRTKLTKNRSLLKDDKQAILDILIEIRQCTEDFCKTRTGPSYTQSERNSAPNHITHSASLDQATVSVIRDTIREEVSKIQKKLEALPPKQPATYASVTKKQPSAPEVGIPKTKPALIVSSKKEVSSPADTLQSWRKSVSFRDTNFSPANIKYVSNNKIRVEFDTLEQREIILQKTNLPDNDVKAEISRKLKPMIVVKGISNDISPDHLVDIITNQNDFIKNMSSDQNDLIFKFKRGNRNKSLYNAVFMVSPSLWRAIIERGRLNVDHQRIHVEEFSPLLQCFKCLQFGHTRNRCTHEGSICSHCSSMTHDFKGCPFKQNKNQIDCYNCIQYHKKHNLQNLKTDHSATSDACPRRVFMLEKLRERIDYGY